MSVASGFTSASSSGRTRRAQHSRKSRRRFSRIQRRTACSWQRSPLATLSVSSKSHFADWAEGCVTRPVGYIEAWYVKPEQRRSGLGRQLMRAAERWVLSRRCTEVGSDAELQNEVSHEAHRALGYVEVTRLVLFAKKLAP